MVSNVTWLLRSGSKSSIAKPVTRPCVATRPRIETSESHYSLNDDYRSLQDRAR